MPRTAPVARSRLLAALGAGAIAVTSGEAPAQSRQPCCGPVCGRGTEPRSACWS